MKALVIADDEKIIKKIALSLKKFGYDAIIYRWLLKALDNIEEISPHLIVISTEDYPRHWKTLTQYSDMGSFSSPKVVLFTGENFSDEERSKAKALAIAGIFKDTQPDSDSLCAFDEILEKLTGKSQISEISEKIEEKVPVEVETSKINEEFVKTEEPDEESETSATMPCSFVFTNPVTLALVSGRARNFNGKTLEFEPDIPEFIAHLSEGTSIKQATLKLSDSIESVDSIKAVSASVISADSERIVLKITA